MESALDAFQVRVARKLTGIQPRRGRDGRWFYPSLAGAMKEAGIVRIQTSILRRQNTVAQFIDTRPILGLCEGGVIRPGARVPRRLWEQTGIDWKGAREKAAATEEKAAEAAEPELTGSESEPEADTPEGAVCGTGEEASLGTSGSSGAGRRINYIGREPKASTLEFFYLRGTESRVQHSRFSGIGTPPPNN